jgi:curved DNA-binding protein CbpA
MAHGTDPYRTLGIPRGASIEEVRRAYRTLAKEFHPDTGGEGATARFLAVQAAYEALIRAAAAGPEGRGARRPPSAGEPWRADADRARAAREAWRSRGGARRASQDQAGAPGAGSRGSTAGTGSGAEGRGRPPRMSRERPLNRATPGSTSYDGAEHDPFDPEWSGASWYGTSSGTYWTINPKEYADPRKHGPEYQARGRRRPGSPGHGSNGGNDARSSDPPGSTSGRRAETRDDQVRSDPEAAGSRSDEVRTRRSSPPPDPTGAAGNGAGSAHASDAGASADSVFGPGPATTSAAWAPGIVRRWLGSRTGLAVIGWPPIGLGVALAIGEATGCRRFAATCEPWAEGVVWLSQLVILAILFAVPSLARLAATGTLTMLAASIPAAAIVWIGGGGRDPEGAPIVLAAILGLAWLGGVVLAATGRGVRASA